VSAIRQPTYFLRVLLLTDALVYATWGLVIATALLVVAAAIPAVRALLEPRIHARRTTVALIPEMHILGSRLRGAADRLAKLSSESDAERVKELGFRIDSSDGELRMVAELIEDAGDAGLKYVNEVYVCRHLITQAKFQMQWALDLYEQDRALNAEEAVAREDHLRRAQRLYLAAADTLDAAEACLPKWARKIDGEQFWDRFARIARNARTQQPSSL
jgi:hypothetical protein